jgi:hypothetical protein
MRGSEQNGDTWPRCGCLASVPGSPPDCPITVVQGIGYLTCAHPEHESMPRGQKRHHRDIAVLTSGNRCGERRRPAPFGFGVVKLRCASGGCAADWHSGRGGHEPAACMLSQRSCGPGELGRMFVRRRYPLLGVDDPPHSASFPACRNAVSWSSNGPSLAPDCEALALAGCLRSAARGWYVAARAGDASPGSVAMRDPVAGDREQRFGPEWNVAPSARRETSRRWITSRDSAACVCSRSPQPSPGCPRPSVGARARMPRLRCAGCPTGPTRIESSSLVAAAAS